MSDDVPVFLALLGDLFPSVELNRLTDASLERTIRQAALDLKLQPEDVFVTRVLQLHELLQVRHSVFLLGKAGTGKTVVWRTLLRAYALLRLRPVCVDIDPKVKIKSTFHFHLTIISLESICWNNQFSLTMKLLNTNLYMMKSFELLYLLFLTSISWSTILDECKWIALKMMYNDNEFAELTHHQYILWDSTLHEVQREF